MIISPPAGDCIPKNTMDQIVFKNNCTMKIINADFTILFLRPSFQTMKSDIPIIRYSTVHTGPNSQLGGLNDGFTSVVYHPLTEEAVKYPAKEPTASGIKTAIMNL